MIHVLFLCTGNSCRSQMAEGFARYLLDPKRFTISSAGIEAHGINPRAITTMQQVGIDITGQHSTQLTEEMLVNATAVITLCDHAAEHCPYIPSGILHRHWSLEDPAVVKGSEKEIQNAFKESREIIQELIQTIPEWFS